VCEKIVDLGAHPIVLDLQDLGLPFDASSHGIVDNPTRRSSRPVDVVLDLLVDPRLDEGIATFESDVTARTQRLTNGDERRVPALVVEEELGHMAGHDRKIGPEFAQVKRLVAPKEHREQVTGDFTMEEYIGLQRLVYRVTEAVREEVGAERM
jgi:hypothetical protein